MNKPQLNAHKIVMENQDDEKKFNKHNNHVKLWQDFFFLANAPMFLDHNNIFF